jgi:hypothetical protein
MTDKISRRELLGGIGLSCVVTVTPIEWARAADSQVCADLAAMDSGEKSVRASLYYTESALDAAKTCAACSFFQPGAGACGTCQIFSGPANARGHCDSWSARL